MAVRWGDEETEVLVGVWGPLFLGRNRGSLSVEDWRAVSDVVNAHHAAAGSVVTRNPAACRRRISDLQKKAAEGQRQRPPGFPAVNKEKEVNPLGFPAVNKEKEVKVDEEEENGWVGGSAGRRKFPVKRRFLRDIFEGESSGGPSPAKMPATLKKEAEVGCGCDCDCPAAVVRMLAGVYERVEVGRQKLKMESAKVKAEAKEPEGAQDN